MLACLVSIDRQNRALGAILMASAGGSRGRHRSRPRPGRGHDHRLELTAHILLSMGAAALLFAAAVTAVLW